MSRKKPPRSYGWKDAFCDAAPSDVDQIPGYLRHDYLIGVHSVCERRMTLGIDQIDGYLRGDDLLPGFSVYERRMTLASIIGNDDPEPSASFIIDAAHTGDSEAKIGPKIGQRSEQNTFCSGKGYECLTSSEADFGQMVSPGYEGGIAALTPFCGTDVDPIDFGTANCVEIGSMDADQDAANADACHVPNMDTTAKINFFKNADTVPQAGAGTDVVANIETVPQADAKINSVTPSATSTALATTMGSDWASLPLANRCAPNIGLRDAVWVSFDTEYRGGEDVKKRWDGRREVVSWQFGFGVGDEFVELLVIPRTRTPLSVDDMLNLLAYYLDVPTYRYDAFPRKRDKNGDWDGRPGTSHAKLFPIVLFSHAGVVDISTLAGGHAVMQRSQNKGAALFSATTPVTRALPADKSRHSFRRFGLYLRDSTSFAAQGSSLAKLGHAVNLPKLEMSEADYLDMGAVLKKEPERFAAYAMRDVEICYRYMSQLPTVRRDTLCAPTAPACAANYMKRFIVGELALDDAGFEREWRGEVRVKDGLEKARSGRGFYMKSHYASVNVHADELIRLARDNMHGGINACFIVGFFPEMSWDYDLTSAYPLALGSLYDPDYSKPFAVTFEDETVTKQSFPHDWFHDPFVPGFGVVDFEFPKSCYQPCIPIKTDHGLVFPRTSEGTSGVSASLAEVMLALALGATIHVRRFVIPHVHDRDGMLLHGYHNLIGVRNEQKRLHGKKSVQQESIKLVNASAYGKLAQDISPKTRRDLWTLETDEIQPSKITNAPLAAAGTALVRCTIIAAINQLHANGYHVYSATTDGFISDAPKKELDSLNLYGLRYRLAWVQGHYTDGASTDIFEIKHTNSGGLLNFTTRGNVGLNVSDDPEKHPEREGVLARAGYKGYSASSLEDRKEFAKRIVTRSAPLEYTVNEWVNAADMLKFAEDFHVTKVPSTSNPNFDLKRKPDLSTMHEVSFEIDGETFSTPTYDTVPYECIREFDAYKSQAKSMQLTKRDRYVELEERAKDGPRTKREPTQRDLVRYAVMAYRSGKADIPGLDALRGSARNSWISGFIEEGRPFTANDWKMCGKQERWSHIPEESVYVDIVKSMGGTMVGV